MEEFGNVTSQSELKMKRWLDKLYWQEEYKDNIRPSWIKNPKTGFNLELDRYYPELKLAFEYQGHYHREDDYQRYKDKIKLKCCKAKNVEMIWVEAKHLKSFEFFKRRINDIMSGRGKNFIKKKAKIIKLVPKKKGLSRKKRAIKKAKIFGYMEMEMMHRRSYKPDYLISSRERKLIREKREDGPTGTSGRTPALRV